MQFTSVRRASQEAEAAGSWGSLQASAPRVSMTSGAACLRSPADCPSARLSLRGLLLALGVTQKGPPGPASGSGLCGRCTGKGHPPFQNMLTPY